jgi:2-polyprenyl-3-methyl-5-hydroxy-6-metoxy-1,4-benzoquinol methylase
LGRATIDDGAIPEAVRSFSRAVPAARPARPPANLNAGADVTRTDLSERHRQNEIMDAPDLPLAHFVETLKGLGTVNTVTRSASLMWPDLKAAAANHPARALRVLDVACGGADVLLSLWRRAAKNGLKVEMAGCDLSTTAVTYARDEAAKAGAPIEFFVHRVPQDPLPEGYDLLMSTLFLHHLDEDAAISFLRDAAAKCRDRIVIQDLVRSIMRLLVWLGTSAAAPERHLPA